MKDLIDAINSVESAIGDLPDSITIDFSVDTYNLIASIYEEQERIANALNRIANALEKQNG